MQKQEVRKTGEFIAVDDSGIEYTVLEFTTYTTYTNQGSRIGTHTVPGRPWYRLRDGTTVLQLDDAAKEFETIGSGKKLHRRS